MNRAREGRVDRDARLHVHRERTRYRGRAARRVASSRVRPREPIASRVPTRPQSCCHVFRRAGPRGSGLERRLRHRREGMELQRGSHAMDRGEREFAGPRRSVRARAGQLAPERSGWRQPRWAPRGWSSPTADRSPCSSSRRTTPRATRHQVARSTRRATFTSPGTGGAAGRCPRRSSTSPRSTSSSGRIAPTAPGVTARSATPYASS